jgi:prepilin-type N-terminal cleavage/methylation domain-containing protein
MVHGVSFRTRPSHGFTLVELMNVLTLAAILVALGMYGLARYVRHAKTAEAVGSVQAIAQAAAAFYNESDANQPVGAPAAAARAMRHFPPPSRTSVPPDPRDVRGQRYQSEMADWDVSPWRELHFSIPQPQCYAYSFDSSGTGVQATASAIAHGDLDGDGSISTYELNVGPDDKLVARVSPDLKRINPED